VECYPKIGVSYQGVPHDRCFPPGKGLAFVREQEKIDWRVTHGEPCVKRRIVEQLHCCLDAMQERNRSAVCFKLLYLLDTMLCNRFAMMPSSSIS